jgi:hypothetical protein
LNVGCQNAAPHIQGEENTLAIDASQFSTEVEEKEETPAEPVS